MNLFAVLAAFTGSVFGIWAIFKYIIFIEFRLDINTYKTLHQVCSNERKFLLQEEFVSEFKPPIVFVALCFFRGAPWFYLNHSERLLTAGWGEGKDSITVVTCFRWQYGHLKEYLRNKLKEMQINNLGVPIELILPRYTDRIGVLKKPTSQPVLPEQVWKEIDLEVTEVFEGRRDKTSALLYGSPGNGKTSFVKYLATKYKVPIKLITFSPDFNNHDLMLIFSQITSNCIVLFEDFDNYFDGRTCILGSGNNGIKFTFDIILNGLDGVYNTYESVVFLMTVNDIKKVDYALKNRPSRFKYVREFKNPDRELRRKLLPEGWISATDNINLDQLFRMKEFFDRGIDLKTAINKISVE